MGGDGVAAHRFYGHDPALRDCILMLPVWRRGVSDTVVNDSFAPLGARVVHRFARTGGDQLETRPRERLHIGQSPQSRKSAGRVPADNCC